MSQMEQTLVIIKPDAVKRQLVGELIQIYEKKGLIIEDMSYGIASLEALEAHYAEHKGKSFYDNLLSFMQSGPSLVMALSGKDAIQVVRKLNGATQFLEAECGSIRGQYALDVTQNVVHGSDSPESAAREIAIWFKS